MTRSVIRHATWTIAPDEGASPPSFVLRCATCGEHSDPDPTGEDAQQWGLEHSGRTHHTEYEGVHTSAWRSRMIDASPEPLIGRRDAAPEVPESRRRP